MKTKRFVAYGKDLDLEEKIHNYFQNKGGVLVLNDYGGYEAYQHWMVYHFSNSTITTYSDICNHVFLSFTLGKDESEKVLDDFCQKFTEFKEEEK